MGNTLFCFSLDVAGKGRYAVVVSEDKENPIRIVGPEEKKILSRDIEKAASK